MQLVTEAVSLALFIAGTAKLGALCAGPGRLQPLGSGATQP